MSCVVVAEDVAVGGELSSAHDAVNQLSEEVLDHFALWRCWAWWSFDIRDTDLRVGKLGTSFPGLVGQVLRVF